MSHSKGLGRGHRRAASCYDLDFDSLDKNQTQTISQIEERRPVSDTMLEKFDFIESFLSQKEVDKEEPSVILDILECSSKQRQRTDLGLKFSSLNRTLMENRKQKSAKIPISTKMVECCESPKSAQSKDRLQRIQVKYVTDLQRIDEDLHEISLANSRNSLAVKNSAQKALARIVRASGSGRKILGELSATNNLILEEFELEKTKDQVEGETNFIHKLHISKDQENIPDNNEGTKEAMSSTSMKPDPLLLSLAEIGTTRQDFRKQTAKTLSDETAKNTQHQTDMSFASQAKSLLMEESNVIPGSARRTYFLTNAIQNSSRMPAGPSACQKSNQSSDGSINLIEKGSSLILKSKAEANNRSCLKSTLQRLYNERAKKLAFTGETKNTMSVNLSKKTLKSNSQEKTKARQQTLILAKCEPKSAILNYQPKGIEPSNSKSAQRNHRGRTPSEITAVKLSDSSNEHKTKKRSASINGDSIQYTLPKSASGFVGVKNKQPSTSAKDDSLFELKNIINSQQVTLNQLRSRVMSLESENSLISSKYTRLKQENTRLQKELSSAIAASLTNAKAFKMVSCRVENLLSVR